MPSLWIFDLDHTLVKKNTSFLFGRHLFRRKQISWGGMLSAAGLYAAHRLFGMSTERLHRGIFRQLFVGLRRQDLLEEMDSFLDEELETYLNLDVWELLRKAQACGDYVALFSNSPCFVVEPVAKRLGITYWKATNYQVDEGAGCLIGISRILDGDEKAKEARNLAEELKLSKESLIAYTDSIYDLPLLKQVGRAAVVNPDAKLLRYAREEGLEVLK